MMEFVDGKDDMPYMKWKIKFMFETTNQLYVNVYHIHINIYIYTHVSISIYVYRWYHNVKKRLLHGLEHAAKDRTSWLASTPTRTFLQRHDPDPNGILQEWEIFFFVDII